MQTTNSADLRKYLKTKLNLVSDHKETIIITRKGKDDVVMIALTEFNNLTKK